MSEEAYYKWCHKKYEIEARYCMYQLISFVIVLVMELIIAAYLTTLNISELYEFILCAMLFIVLILNFIMLHLNYEANPEYVEDADD